MAGPGLVDATSALATVPMATGPQWEAPPRAPFTGMQWTVGLIGLFAYLFVIHQGVAPIGEVAVLTAAAGVFLGGGRVRLPREVAIFAVFVSIAGFSILGSDFLQKSLDTWLDYLKLWLIFFVACNLVRTPAQLRTLILVWLLFFALYPMRGSLLNYAAGISHNGRVAWNFTFNNPNDLAGLCIFPATMAAGLLVTERRGPIWFGALLSSSPSSRSSSSRSRAVASWHLALP